MNTELLLASIAAGLAVYFLVQVWLGFTSVEWFAKKGPAEKKAIALAITFIPHLASMSIKGVVSFEIIVGLIVGVALCEIVLYAAAKCGK